MKTTPPTVLIIEDNPMIATTYKFILRKEPVKLIYVETGAAALAQLQQIMPNAILLDLMLPDMDGMEILKYVQRQQFDCAIIVVSAATAAETIKKATHHGAFSFIEKPFQADLLLETLRHALHQSKPSKITAVKKENRKRVQYCNMIGASKQMQKIYKVIDQVASSKASVLITGDSGTGKELCARAIHEQSKRKDQPFITINCATTPKDLIESQLFGHGTSAGAASEKQGAAYQANGGTLFLDEIGELDLRLQSILQSFVETGEFYKVDSLQLETVDVRIICATKRNLLSEIEAGRFRKELYYRLEVISITLPPLHEREGDILLLAHKFLREMAQLEQKSFQGFTPEVENCLLNYEWPSNVRQLQNVIQNIVVLNEGPMVTIDMLPPLTEEILSNGSNLSRTASQAKPAQLAKTQVIRPFWQVEKDTIEQAIEFCNGNVAQAAKLLELGKATIYRKLHIWKNIPK